MVGCIRGVNDGLKYTMNGWISKYFDRHVAGTFCVGLLVKGRQDCGVNEPLGFITVMIEKIVFSRRSPCKET